LLDSLRDFAQMSEPFHQRIGDKPAHQNNGEEGQDCTDDGGDQLILFFHAGCFTDRG